MINRVGRGGFRGRDLTVHDWDMNDEEKQVAKIAFATEYRLCHGHGLRTRSVVYHNLSQK